VDPLVVRILVQKSQTEAVKAERLAASTEPQKQFDPNNIYKREAEYRASKRRKEK
jgi:hypothetical protein